MTLSASKRWPRTRGTRRTHRPNYEPGSGPCYGAPTPRRADLGLTPTEPALVEMFLRNPRRVPGRTQIFETIRGHDFGPDSNAPRVTLPDATTP
ncbi:helix-turn-helix domain-containing protein [Catenulispora pinistramenti]|uniref:helix-turn-helix domain-containing protein n=1 Tax=Catenulispora pinistramenti TaxID=2705254 RepID=UPI002E78290C|nr:helix-turn-helix domain-containing protein [Catenulispora pinistramenti]